MSRTITQDEDRNSRLNATIKIHTKTTDKNSALIKCYLPFPLFASRLLPLYEYVLLLPSAVVPPLVHEAFVVLESAGP